MLSKVSKKMEIKHEAMEILLSIKPKYVKQILDGLKRVEFRKQSFKFKKNSRVFIYSSSPEKMLVAYFTVKDVQKKPIQDLWEEYSHVGGIDEEDFFEYFKNKMFGFAIEIDELKRFSDPVDPYNLFESFTPPQSYQYLRKHSLKKIEQHIAKIEIA
jgi:type I restriction enzyme, S subunit